MSLSKIRSAFADAIVDGEFFPAECIAWENRAFNPPETTPWMAFYFLPAQPAVATLGIVGFDEQLGFVQLSLNYPQGKGESDVMAKYLTIKNAFQAGSRLIYQGQEVIIRSCGRSQGRVVNNFWRVDITVYFYAEVIRE